MEGRVAALEARVRELEQLLADREEELRALRGQLLTEQKAREEEEKLKKELIEKNVRLTSELSELNDLSSSFVSSSQVCKKSRKCENLRRQILHKISRKREEKANDQKKM